MENSVKQIIEEHAQLINRIQKLNDYVYSERSENDDKVEFANKCVQLSAMKKYEEALRARLENQNIIFVDGAYFQKLGELAPIPINVLDCETPIDHEANNDQKAKAEN